MSETAIRDAVLTEHLHTLRLPGMAREYPALARQARDGGWAYEEFLRCALEAELRSRQESVAAHRLREAHFPDIKTLDQLDWKALQGISRPKLLELSSCEFLNKAEDVILAGPIGTGKTHVAIGLGVEATRRRFRVTFTRAAELVRTLLEARDERLLGKLHRKTHRADLLIVDELGFVPFDRAGGELLFNLLSERYERRSTLITTNLAFSEWVQVFGDAKLTTALLDRLGHHSHILTTRGPSYRSRNREREAAAGLPTSPPHPEGKETRGTGT
ncbi:MAG TPA: IS21-like element helper ATPase IstB [Dehalococcoidia bacterium]|nr:IS21-like element helper ATPase IstB [Dehalococcoidia bacterium]